jgi:hypothetical protein
LNNIKVDYLPVRYSYETRQLTKNSLAVAYGYSSDVASTFATQTQGYQAPATQAILNNLPQWMEMRQKTDSNGWKLVNSWGQNLEHVIELTASYITERHLHTADKFQRSLLYSTNLYNRELIETKVFNNLLFNSNYSILAPARTKLPLGWIRYNSNNYNNVYLVKNKAYICPNSMLIDGAGSFGQSVYVNNSIAETISFSIYYLSNLIEDKVILLTIIEMQDGTVKHAQATSTTSSSEWRRLHSSIRIDGSVYRIHFVVQSESDSKVYFNAPKLEVSNFATKWSRSTLDALPYLDSSNYFSQVCAIGNVGIDTKKIAIQPVSTQETFLNIDIPTRIEKITGVHKDLEPFVTNVQGRKISFFNEVFDTTWKVEEGKIKEKSFGPSEFDVYAEYNIRDLTIGEEVTYGTYNDPSVSIVPQLLTVRGTRLFILVKETYLKETKFVLKICNAREPANKGGYLESLADFEIEVPTPGKTFVGQLDEILTTLAFSEVNPNVMLITTNLGRQLFYRLYYDYYYNDVDTNKVYMIESYPNSKIQVI